MTPHKGLFQKGNPGRPKGAIGKRTVAARKAIAEATEKHQGLLPHQILLKIGANPKTPIELRVSALTAAAPYFAPRLSAVAVQHEDVTRVLSPEEVAAEIGRINLELAQLDRLDRLCDDPGFAADEEARLAAKRRDNDPAHSLS